MLPGLRFLFAAVVLATSLLVFGLGAASLFRAAHEEFASIPARRAPPEPQFAQQSDTSPVLAMVRVDRALRSAGLDGAMLLQIHDELIFEIARSQVDEIARLVKHEMEHALELSVPVEVTLKTGQNWYDVESYAT